MGPIVKTPWLEAPLMIPLLLVVGFLIGVIAIYVFILVKPEVLLRPVTDNIVKATIAAQPTPKSQVPLATVAIKETVVIPEVIQVTPTPNPSVYQVSSSIDKNISLHVFPYEGNRDTELQGYSDLAIRYDDGEINYIFDFTLPVPETGYTWAGIAMRLDEPVNLAQYEYLEVAVQFSDVNARCQLTLADKFDHTVYFLLEPLPSSKPGVVTTVDGDRQIVRIPLRGYLDSINLEQVKEFGIIADSSYVSGKHQITLSRIKFLKQ